MFKPLPRRSSGKKKRNKDLSPVFEKTDTLSLRISQSWREINGADPSA
jgi:hypothetical protein